jgi:hypothetical protein
MLLFFFLLAENSTVCNLYEMSCTYLHYRSIICMPVLFRARLNRGKLPSINFIMYYLLFDLDVLEKQHRSCQKMELISFF